MIHHVLLRSYTRVLRQLGQTARVRRVLERCTTCYRFHTGTFKHCRFYAWDEVVDRLQKDDDDDTDDFPTTTTTTLLISVTTARRAYGVRDATMLTHYHAEGFPGSYVTLRDVEYQVESRRVERANTLRAAIAHTPVADVRTTVGSPWWSRDANAYVVSGEPGLRRAVSAEVEAVRKRRVSIDALRTYATLSLNISDDDVEDLTFQPSSHGSEEVVMRRRTTGSAWCYGSDAVLRTYAYVHDCQRIAMLHVFRAAQLPEDIGRLVVSCLTTTSCRRRLRRPPTWMVSGEQ